MRKEGMHKHIPARLLAKRKEYGRQWSSSITLFVCCLLSSNISARAREREKKNVFFLVVVCVLSTGDNAFFSIIIISQTSIAQIGLNLTDLFEELKYLH